MDFFDKLGKKASETYKGAAEKTGKIAKEAKMKLKIADLRSDITDIYEEIGKKVYLEHSTGKKHIDIKKELLNESTKLDEINNEIAELQKQCLELQDRIKCFKCSEEIEKDVNYCPFCGAMQSVVKVENDIEDDSAIQVEIEELEIINKEQKNNYSKSKKENKKETEKAKSELEKTVEIESAVEKDDKKKEDK